jgi:hypothetical protein
MLMVHSIWPESNGGHEPLPPPNVVVARAGARLEALPPEAIKGILVNPIYTGVGPFPRLVEDAAWVRACAKLIEEEGAQQFLVNLLYVLRECLPGDTDQG